MRLIIFFLILTVPWLIAPVHAQDINVPDDFSTIQRAIDAIAETPTLGDTIIVDVGTYEENLNLISNITLRGKETARTILKVDDNTLPLLRMNQVSNVTLQNFTFNEGDIAVEVLDSSNVLMTNNVFNAVNETVDIETVGIRILGNSNFTIEIFNNTFVDLDRAIIRNDEATNIQNNIFSKNKLPIDSVNTSGAVSYNCFFDNDQQDIQGTNAVTGNDPLFVNATISDFHLLEGSPCIDQGLGDDIIDESDADMGAYGGQFADLLPYPVQISSATDITASVGSSTVEVTWGKNNAYLITHTAKPGGYKVYYDSDGSGSPYKGTDAEGGSKPSPINVANVNTFRLTDLSPKQTAPVAPTLIQLDIGNGQFRAHWTAQSGATSYNIHYGLNDTQEQQIPVGNVTSFTVTGLANGASYVVAISAVSQPTYYIAVSAYDSTGKSDHESALSEEKVVTLGQALNSALSNELTVIPETTQAFPRLPDEGCFIATAAYGFYNAPQVQSLRDFRDRYLLTHQPGRALVHFYYTYSPPLAAYIAERPGSRMLVRIALLPFVAMASFLTQTSPWVKLFVALLMLAATFIGWRRALSRRPQPII